MPARPELLAPAGSWEALVAAVQNGADAVYLGGRAFNARHSAANFSAEELARAVRYAHVRGVKVYVTVNTLVGDGELEEAARFLFFLQNAGADAAILQDLGLASLARAVVPELPLHASTQMNVHNAPAVQHLCRNLGIKRVILARELSADEIKRLKKETGAQIEVFIHGALCICYSGQCLFSSLVGGRSGNRGRCAQPCRLPYTLVDGRGRLLADPGRAGEYLLSPRDLNVSRHLPVLLQAGVDALKIEGRLKKPEYVAVVTRVYRQLIDRAAAAGPEGFSVTPEEEADLARIFNREFTPGYLAGRPGRLLMSTRRPNNRGVFLGRVRRRGEGWLEIALEEDLSVGDGLEVWVTEGGRDGFEVREIIAGGERVASARAGQAVRVAYRGPARTGDRVFKTHDRRLIEQARATFASPRETKKVPVYFSVRGKVGEPLVVSVRDAEGNAGEGRTLSVGEPAARRPLTSDFLLRQLDRLGNTPFQLAGLDSRLEGEVIYPAGEINAARRRALEALEAAREEAARPTAPVGREVFERRLTRAAGDGRGPGSGGRGEVPGSGRGAAPLLSVYAGSPAAVRAAAGAGAGLVYFGGDVFGFPPAGREDLAAAWRFCKERGVKFFLATPRVLKDGELPAVYELCREACSWPVDGILVANLGLLEKIRHLGVRFGTDLSFNVFNARAAGYLGAAGAAHVALSPELTREQVREIAARAEVPVEILVHGGVELMVSEHCVPGSVLGGLAPGERCARPCRKEKCFLQDRLGVLFPVEVDRYCRMHIFNSREICLLDELRAAVETGAGILRIDARRHGPDYVAKVTRAYRQALAALEKGEKGPEKEELLPLLPGGVTTGHFFRGVE
jgi:putative protease